MWIARNVSSSSATRAFRSSTKFGCLVSFFCFFTRPPLSDLQIQPQHHSLFISKISSHPSQPPSQPLDQRRPRAASITRTHSRPLIGTRHSPLVPAPQVSFPHAPHLLCRLH